jgi:hypothetical protein
MIMDHRHERWAEFCDTLAAAINFKLNVEDPDRSTWDCAGGYNKSNAERILRSWGFNDLDISATMAHFNERDGHCDCEILWNVAAPLVDPREIEAGMHELGIKP